MDEETQGTESEEEVEAHRSKLPRNVEAGEGEGDDVEAHRSKLPATDEPEGEDDDVEAHRNVFGRNAADDADDAAALERNKTP